MPDYARQHVDIPCYDEIPLLPAKKFLGCYSREKKQMRSLSPVSGISEIPQKEGESSIFLLWTLLSVDNTKKQIGMP